MKLALASLIYLLVTAAAQAAPASAAHCPRDADPSFGAIVAFSNGPLTGYVVAEPIADAPYELHLVGSYEGSGTVTIGPTPKPVILVLSSYESSRWQIKLSDGARLARVLVSGHKPAQLVTGLPEAIAIEQLDGVRYSYVWQGVRGNTSYMTEAFKQFVVQIRCLAGQDERSFQGSYGLGETFSVPPNLTGIEKVATIVAPQTARTTVALDAADTLAAYQATIIDMAPELQPAAALLVSLMQAGKLPVFFPDGQTGEDPFAPADLRALQFPSLAETRTLQTGQRDCNDRGNAGFIGTAAPDTFSCAWGNQWYALGSGGDVINDSWGDDLFVAGSGDQIFDMGWGNDIAILQAGWGSVVVDKTCHFSSVAPADMERLDWTFDYNSFLVFGPGLDPAAFSWLDARTLLHAPTGDRLTLASDCFNLVFAEPGELPLRPAAS